MKRHEDAIFISDGACNVSGIADSLIEACQEARRTGTGDPQSDPAVLLIVSQIAYLVGIWDGVSDWQNTSWQFGLARDACRAAIAQEAVQEGVCL